MRTINFKLWAAALFLCTTTPRATVDNLTEREVVCINVNHGQNYAAVVDGERNIYYIPWTEGWQDGDFGTITYTSDNAVVAATSEARVWRYDNNGTFTQVVYPWWYTGNKPSVVHTEVVR